MQGGLEISIQVTAEMELTKKNRQCLETPVDEKYNELMGGKFEDATHSILQRLKEPEYQEDTGNNIDLDLDS